MDAKAATYAWMVLPVVIVPTSVKTVLWKFLVGSCLTLPSICCCDACLGSIIAFDLLIVANVVEGRVVWRRQFKTHVLVLFSCKSQRLL